MNNNRIFIIDEVMLRPDKDGNLIIELRTNEEANKIKVTKEAALSMARAMHKMYLQDSN